MIKEFKEFISKGNVIDLAVGMIIGGAFGKIVSSLVNDLISPLIGLLTGKADLTSFKWVIKAGEIIDGENVGAVIVEYGNFLQNILDFLIIGFVIFMLIKSINKFKRQEKVEDKKEEIIESETELLLKEILNELKTK